MCDLLCLGPSNVLLSFISRQHNPHLQADLSSNLEVHFSSIYHWKAYHKHYVVDFTLRASVAWEMALNITSFLHSGQLITL